MKEKTEMEDTEEEDAGVDMAVGGRGGEGDKER